MNNLKIQSVIKQAPALLTDEEGQFLFDLALNLKLSGAIVEIGSYKGGSTVLLALGSRQGLNNKVYAIDPHIGVYPVYENTKDIFLENLANWHVNGLVKPIFKKSHQAIKDWHDPISLLWIDGGHWYLNIRLDILYWEKFLMPGGLIIFHDASGSGEPWRFFNKKVVRFPGVEQSTDELLVSGRFRGIKRIGRILVATKVGSDLSLNKIFSIKINYFFRRIFLLELKYIFFPSLIIKIHYYLGRVGQWLINRYPGIYYFLKDFV